MSADQISLLKFNILVVDDNTVCLNVISSMLRRWKYEVVTVNCPLNALAVTRVQNIDLVLSDLHMPKMNGIELQKQIEAEAKLPVVIMSSDDNKEIILESLSSGAMFFMSKPVNSEDLKNLWQYVVASKRDKSMRCVQKIKSIQAGIGKLSDNDDNNFASSMNKGKHPGNKKDCKRKSYLENLENEEEKNSVAPKKKKVVWNTGLHNRFLQAITHLTLEKAVPKNILEFMNVPGLTRANVASHLQKYRIALKKVVEKGYGVTSEDSMTLDRTFQSIFPTGHSIMFKNTEEAYMKFKGVLEKQTSTPLRSLNPTNFGPIGGLSSSNSRLASFSSSSPFGFGQSCVLGGNTQANVHKPLILGNTSPLFQSNRTNHGIIHMNDDGNLIASKGQMRLDGSTDGLNGGPYLINGAHSLGLGVGAVKDSTFTTSWAIGKSSFDGFNGNYQSSTSLPGVNFEQGSTSTLPSVAPQKFDLQNNELNDFMSKLMSENNNNASSFSKPQQFGKITNMLMESTNFQSPHHQQQGAEGFENLNFASNLPFPSETNRPASQPLDGLGFPSGFCAKENHILEEPSLEQLLDIQEFLNPDFEDNIANPGDHYYPMLEKIPHQGLR